jgi:hypothetical protein
VNSAETETTAHPTLPGPAGLIDRLPWWRGQPLVLAWAGGTPAGFAFGHRLAGTSRWWEGGTGAAAAGARDAARPAGGDRGAAPLPVPGTRLPHAVRGPAVRGFTGVRRDDRELHGARRPGGGCRVAGQDAAIPGRGAGAIR